MKELESNPNDIINIAVKIAESTIGADLVSVEPSDEPISEFEVAGVKVIMSDKETAPARIEFENVENETFSEATKEEIEKAKSLLIQRKFGEDKYLEEWEYKKCDDDCTIHAISPQRSWMCLYGRHVKINLSDNSLKIISMN